MEMQAEFERLLGECKNAVERLVFYKVDNRADGEDILQEVYAAAYTKLHTLGDIGKFKQWIFAIARNKVRDYYRAKSKAGELPLDEGMSYRDKYSRIGLSASEAVAETLSAMSDIDSRVLRLYYMSEKSQKEIASLLNIPVGTVKSRLHNAKRHFAEAYPYPPTFKGDKNMLSLPITIPEIKIEKSNMPAFSVVWEECINWFIVPRIGEKRTWAIYDYPSKARCEVTELSVIGKAVVHGIEGVEILCKEVNPIHGSLSNERTLIAQLTDTHTRFLMESHCQNGVKLTHTFYDEQFLENWSVGADNCGNETHIKPNGVERYNVTIGSKSYDTILVTYIETDANVMTHTYLDRHGRTILWRRFNKSNWTWQCHGKSWGDMLPQNERCTVNDSEYVHWYDCITDYITDALS